MRAASVLASALLMLIVAGCAKKPAFPEPYTPPPSTLDLVSQHGELRVCSTGDYRPFTYRDPKTDRWSGIDIDMAGDMAQKLGVKLTIVPTTWANLAGDLSAQRCDIAMGGVSVTTSRAKIASYSDPYLMDGKAPITRCSSVSKFQNLDMIDRPGVRVVVNPGGTNNDFARSHLKKATIVPHPDNNTIFDQLLQGKADLMITDASETRYQSKQHPELCPVNPDKPLDFGPKAYLLPRGDVVFQQWVNEWLRLALGNGTYQRFAKPWTG
ncbi:transporter substrate-binding domain-containing protein [Pseudonocardia spinosispora]|uniref:transporter substrate-binding domain-containing protein n=1 Tax=Pseudonocardia spinosispora TaxID=103441 RepID=UPI00040CB519|nr:transporter substrate-binding domain-containing protein [Pseudonocardia spinosispora]